MMRINLLKLFFLGSAVFVLYRLFDLQVARSQEFKSQGASQHQSLLKVPARRGAILASDGFPLAASSEAWLLWSDPQKLDKSAEEVARSLAPILLQDGTQAAEATLSALLKKEGARWVALAHKLSPAEKEKIESLGISGLGFEEEEQRSYPEASAAAHLLGFVGKDAAGEDRGYFGLEGHYDLTLKGVSGELAREKDPRGLPILVGFFKKTSALDGMNIKTHIDRTIQFLVQKQLALGIEKYGASQGSVIVMRPADGAILAASTLPAYDPANFSSHSQEEFTNPTTGLSFEPGSVFKILVMAAALDSGVVEPDTRCTACSGPRTIAEYTIGTWNDEYHPDSTATDIIVYSDNVGMIWLAEKLGADRLHDYLVRFGIGKPTGVDLQDEASPQLRAKKDWKFIDLAVASFGQGIALTPIQMLRAVAAIANDGVLPVPQVVDKIQGSGFGQDIKPKLERVISPDKARQVTQMMVKAVESGEARWAKPAGFKIAGKTGTAQIPVSGHYDQEKTIASFVGFAPAEDPEFVMLVTLKEPTSSPWGSETAAPLWFSIARDLFPYLGIQPE